MLFKTPPADFKKWADVVACYVQNGGDIILLHRHAHKSNGNTWGLPAGKIDAGETMHQAMRREIREETGIEIPETDLVYFDSVFVRHEGRDFHYHMFSTTLGERPEIRLSPSEHKAAVWVSPREALSMNLIFDLDECIRLFYPIRD